ncbi:MAG: isopentenyl-diphosphate delta-isomerase [Lachnospiraceae bacterium]|nr:isopentenyl-diphosphate delta-isomerase [Lachnospiraceae bacterium]
MRQLEKYLQETDHKSYPAYKRLTGSYRFPNYTLTIDHVQGDPFAAPSSLHITLSEKQHKIPADYYKTPHRRIMLQDFILRRFESVLKTFDHQTKGSGKSGTLSVTHCHQEVLDRSALQINPTNGELTVRFSVGFPAAGRTTLSMELKKILMNYLPECVQKSLVSASLPADKLQKAIALSDDQQFLRSILSEKNLVAFIANGSVLPRKSGVDDRPMKDAITFVSPKESEITLPLPNGRSITGLGIQKGITLIVGGGYHGKSTLLKALERGIYNHIPGDGREYVITEDTAMKIRSEDGRCVKQLNIHPFIRNLPNNANTTCFVTEDASGSTSQAAFTIESILAGSKTLLIDEDTTATNFMVRDDLMQQVIAREEEPIVPFISRMRQLYDTLDISTILVAGSCGTYFATAHHVIQMKNYEPYDITATALQAASTIPPQAVTAPDPLPDLTDLRVPLANRAVTNQRKVKVKSSGTNAVSLNHESVELRFVEQLVDTEQSNLLGLFLRHLEEHSFDGKTTLADCVNSLYTRYRQTGFSAIANGNTIPGNLADVRLQELWAMVNRYRGLTLR